MEYERDGINSVGDRINGYRTSARKGLHYSNDYELHTRPIWHRICKYENSNNAIVNSDQTVNVTGAYNNFH